MACSCGIDGVDLERQENGQSSSNVPTTLPAANLQDRQCGIGSALTILWAGRRTGALTLGLTLAAGGPALGGKTGHSGRREATYRGVNSSKLSGMLIEIMRASRKPAGLIIASNSLAARSRPPAVHNIIVRSSKAWLWVIGPGWTRPGRTRSTMSNLASGAMARRHDRSISVARESSQS
jgi:hypothetical protein